MNERKYHKMYSINYRKYNQICSNVTSIGFTVSMYNRFPAFFIQRILVYKSLDRREVSIEL